MFFLRSLFQEAWRADLKQIRNGKTVDLLKMITLALGGVGWGCFNQRNGYSRNVKRDKWSDDFGLLGGSMGDDQDILAKMRNIQLQGGAF